MADYLWKYLPSHLLGLTGLVAMFGHEITAGAVFIVGSMLLLEMQSQRSAADAQPQRREGFGGF